MDLEMLKTKGLPYLYEYIDKLTYYTKFKEVDNEIKQFLEDNYNYPFYIYVGFLTVTFRFKSYFKHRKALWDKTISLGEKQMTDKQVRTTLIGLE